ncbi:DUF6538 domain-containing protein [Methylomonas koyamae]|uniref:DUF6538 domain-containing protein n=1 Tax=Methylomonas koyamae TaxID=702114 RepID=UPI0035C16BC6
MLQRGCHYGKSPLFAVPAKLRELVKSREIIQSLRTQNSDEAERRALLLAAHFKTLLHDLKAGKSTGVLPP